MTLRKFFTILFCLLLAAACKKDTPVIQDRWNKQLLDKTWVVYNYTHQGVVDNNRVAESFQFRSDGNLYFVGRNPTYRDTVSFKVLDHLHLSFAKPSITRPLKSTLAIDRLTYN